jgi:hypothetical protein
VYKISLGVKPMFDISKDSNFFHPPLLNDGVWGLMLDIKKDSDIPVFDDFISPAGAK